jgi:transketolase
MAEHDARIWAIDGDLADSDGALHFAGCHADRFLMAGIAEQSMISLAAGMASCGLRPWVFSFAAFLCYRAYDQIRVCVSATALPVVLVGSHSGGCGGRNGKTHQALNDIALIASLPNLQVWAPGDPADLFFAMAEITSAQRPAYLRLPRDPLPELGGTPAACRWIGPPASVALVGAGYSTHWAIEVREALASHGIETGVIHCARLAPFPCRELRQLLSDCRVVFVLDDHCGFGGLPDLMRHCGLPLAAPSFCWPTSWTGGSGSSDALREANDLAPAAIAEAIAAALRLGGNQGFT